MFSLESRLDLDSRHVENPRASRVRARRRGSRRSCEKKEELVKRYASHSSTLQRKRERQRKGTSTREWLAEELQPPSVVVAPLPPPRTFVEKEEWEAVDYPEDDPPFSLLSSLFSWLRK